ncbi:MAG: plasma-membrane proton-efflux P-type ATPase [Anaerolineae bacterium]|nr:plasma-membrane proton-efflux P-type ATPase [Anaerolineae bacterium]
MINALNLQGLTNEEVQERLHKFGRNQIVEETLNPIKVFLSKFWGPIPCLLEITLLLQLVLGKTVDALIIMAMLIVNAVISYSSERRAQNSLAALQQRLTIQARTLRDGDWQLIAAQELVPDDIVRLRVGDIVPADALLMDGHIAVDQSMLTGESELVEVQSNGIVYAASVIRRGEGIARISATGMQTSYSQTAKLVQTAKTLNHGDVFVQKIVTNLLMLTLVLAGFVLIYALAAQLALTDALLFTLALLIAAIPVSLPVTFTLATAIGSRELARNGVLATRLAAIKEAAGMDVLCSDKTGTITTNQLRVVATHTYNSYSKHKLLRLAALASDEATHDPLDLAILQAAREAKRRYRAAKRVQFTPFDPATKRTEAVIHKINIEDKEKKRKKEKGGKRRIRVIKGLPQIINNLTQDKFDITPDVDRLTADGNRCLAIAAGKDDKSLRMVGLLALQDPPRKDAAEVVERLHELGIRVIMVTGDGAATAQGIAHEVGIDGEACTAEEMNKDIEAAVKDCNIFARVYPEDKFKLVQALQQAGHIVGMTGDGINDAPAIRQAQVGVAVNNATDITKSAASLVLTDSGLKDMLAAVEVGRSIFQRITTYTLNKIIKTFHMGLFLTCGLILTGTLIAQPTHILLVVLANDLVSMSLTTDRVRPSAKPDRWRVRPLVISGAILALAWLAFSFMAYFYGRDVLQLDSAQLQTLVFLMLVYISQANVYIVRERRHLWSSRPSPWMLLATAFDLILVGILAVGGILMTAISPLILLQLLAATVIFTCILDLLKSAIFRYFHMN